VSDANGGNRRGCGAVAWFAELQLWIDPSLGPVVRACRKLLNCLNQRLQELGPDEVIDRAGALSRDDACRPLAGHCGHQIC
jgi:hypothetical protein